MQENKLFAISKGIANSLLEHINLYDLLSNQNDNVKEHIWTNLHHIFMSSEYLKPRSERDITK